MTSGCEPVRWWCWDDWCRPLGAGETVPPADALVWEVSYDNDCERGKRTTRTPGVVPYADYVLARLRERAGVWSGLLGYPVEDDPTLHGGGLHVTSAGGHLGCHLDYDRHPHTDEKRRALNVIAFLHPQWGPAWGGELYLADPLGRPVKVFEPRPGRLVAFEVSDISYHGVAPTAADAGERVSVAAYFLSPATAANTRRRALFLPARG